MDPSEARQLARMRDALLDVVEESRRCVDMAAEQGSVDLRALEKSLLNLIKRGDKASGDGVRLLYRGRDDWRGDGCYPGPFRVEQGSAGIWRVNCGDGTRVFVTTDPQMAEFVASSLTSEACARACRLTEAGECNLDDEWEEEDL